MILLRGDAGVGKTRLATELQRRALATGMPALWGGCSEAELSLPYLPFLEAIGNSLRGADVELHRSRLGPLSRDLAALFPQIDPRGPPPADGGDLTQSSKLRLFEAVVMLLTSLAENDGILLVIEDVHWADVSTRELLDYLARRMRGVRIMMLATYRGEDIQPGQALAQTIQGWQRSGRATLVELRSLPPEGVGAMVCAIFGLDAVSEKTRDFLHARSEGNPFVLEELLKTAVDRGAGFPRGAAWDQATLSGIKLPKTVRENILLRVQRLSEEEAEILHCAAVLGTSFDSTTLTCVAGGDEQAVVRSLKACVQQQLLQVDSLTASRYHFRHALTQQAVYEDVLPYRRQRLHERAADVLAQLPGIPPIEVCHHLMAAQRWERAVPFGLAAAEAAVRAHAYWDGAALYERTVPHLVESSKRGTVLCRLGYALLIAGDVAGAERYLEQGVRTLDAAGEDRRAAIHRRWLAWAYYQRSRPLDAEIEAERAIAALEPLGASEELADAYTQRALLHAVPGETDRALPLAQRALATAEAVGADAARINALYVLGRAMAEHGRVDEGIDSMDRSYTEAMAHGLTWIAGQALFHCTAALNGRFRPCEALQRVRLLRSLQGGGFASLRASFLEGLVYASLLGEPLKALPPLKEAIALGRGGESTMLAQNAEQYLALAYVLLDRLDEARPLLREPPPNVPPRHRLSYSYGAMRLAIDSGQAAAARADAVTAFECTNANAHHLRAMADLPVEVLLAAGDIDEAERLVAIIRGLAPDPDNPYQLRMEGRLALGQGDLEQARDRLRAAAEFFMKAEMGSHEARTRWALAEALERLGDVSAAEAQLRRAMQSARTRGAAFEERRAREQLARLGVRLGATTEMVRDALERLEDKGTLMVSPLMKLRRIESGSPTQLRDLLTRVIGEIASSSSAREAEAGALLRDYYVKRVGSQEVVAERLHLSRPTFYRRLHHGWELVAQRLGPLDELTPIRQTVPARD